MGLSQKWEGPREADVPPERSWFMAKATPGPAPRLRPLHGDSAWLIKRPIQDQTPTYPFACFVVSIEKPIKKKEKTKGKPNEDRTTDRIHCSWYSGLFSCLEAMFWLGQDPLERTHFTFLTQSKGCSSYGVGCRGKWRLAVYFVFSRYGDFSIVAWDWDDVAVVNISKNKQREKQWIFYSFWNFTIAVKVQGNVP